MSARRRAFRALLSVLVTLAGLALVPAAPAQAAVSTLCKGYQACNKAGMSAAGYANASKTMYWRMYAGHNCTNYAAYRMVQSGMPNVRPWSGGGNATYWGTSMSSITDQTPTVGSIAWWKAGSYPAGSSGHVAYVEQVVSPDEIVISQDSWGGDFSWARISRGRGWPDGFIHFNDAPLVNVEKPVVAGTPKVGGELVATPGAWAPGEVNTEYRWLVDGKRLRTADAAVLPLDESLLGRRIKVRVIATRIGYPTAKATSPATEAVLPGTLAVTEQPTVSGTPTVDEELILDPGAWSPAPDSVEQVWKVDGKRAGTGRTLPLTPDLVGRTVTAEVTATRAGYEPVKVDAAKLVVASGTQRVTREPRMRGGARPGQELRLSRIETARAADVQVRWLRDGIEVPGATGRRYELTPQDLGHRVTAEVTARRAGYTPVSRTLRSTQVRTPADVRLHAKRDGNKLRVTARVDADDLDTVAGTVQVVMDGQIVKEKRLRAGKAEMVLRDVPRRAFKIKVVHPRTTVTVKDAEVRRIPAR